MTKYVCNTALIINQIVFLDIKNSNIQAPEIMCVLYCFIWCMQCSFWMQKHWKFTFYLNLYSWRTRITFFLSENKICLTVTGRSFSNWHFIDAFTEISRLFKISLNPKDILGWIDKYKALNKRKKSPCYFIIFINDWTFNLTVLETVLLADNITLFNISRSPQEVQEAVVAVIVW